MFKSLALAAVAVAATTAVHAADLIIDEPAPVGVVDVGGNWDGPFIGVFGGYGWGEYSDSDPTTFDVDGWVLGLALGANFTVADGIVAGVVADIAWSNIISDNPGTYDAGLDWVGSLRGRLGFDGGAFLPYLTGGLAVADGAVFDDVNGDDSALHVGWTVGAGVEFAVSENLSVDLLYRYSDYGSQTYNVGLGDYDASFTTHQATIGLNWSF
jgi:outer membrane immunogenic protein